MRPKLCIACLTRGCHVQAQSSQLPCRCCRDFRLHEDVSPHGCLYRVTTHEVAIRGGFICAKARVPDYELAPRFVMVDADEAQLNGIEEVFDSAIEEEKPVSLMCYFHVMAKVHEKCRALQPLLAARVMRDIADLHYTSSAGEYEDKKAKLLSDWDGDDRLSAFSKALKRDYTLHSPLKMGALIEQLLQCCRVKSLKEKQFATEVTPPSVLVRRARELARAQKIRELATGRSRVAFLLNDALAAADSHVYVASELCDRVYDPQDRRTSEALPVTSRLSVQTACAEVRGMPGEGWRVDVHRRHCSGDYHLKFGVCVHVVFALHVHGLLDMSTRKKLAYRGANQAVRAQSERQHAGRPVRNSTELNRE
ncbi:unnamed protein product [Phytophthora fragariaefolia]|uniref:Unnamed protein product n=1 Tax=Phytophthora fragariaefolia TaxID=1490495 RepID=A0A9W6TM10_9STRA|nr:unnamed protein product [Phytophthora fragariaefolia]